MAEWSVVLKTRSNVRRGKGSQGRNADTRTKGTDINGKAYKSDNVRAFKVYTYISEGNVNRRSCLGLIRLNNTRCGSQDVNRNVHFCCRNIKTEIGCPECEPYDPPGESSAGKPHARFGEQGAETT